MYLSILTGSICDRSFEVAAAVAWSQLVVNVSSMLMQAEAEEASSTMPTQVDNKARSYTQEVCVEDHGPWCHDSWAQCFKIGDAMYVPFMYTSKCQSEWSSGGLEAEEE